MALLGLVMAALLVLSLIVIGFLISRLWKENTSLEKICECLGPCLRSGRPRSGHRDSLQFTNDGFQKESDPSRGSRWTKAAPRRSGVLPLERRSRHCSACGVYANHVAKRSPAVRRSRSDGDAFGSRSILSKQRRKEGQKTVWFKESEDSSDIEVEIIPDSVGRVEEETEEQLQVEVEGVVRDPAAPRRDPENQSAEPEPEPGDGSDKKQQQEEEER